MPRVRLGGLLASKRRTNCSTFLGMLSMATSSVKTNKRVNLKCTKMENKKNIFRKKKKAKTRRRSDGQILFEQFLGFVCYSQFLWMELLVVLLDPENLYKKLMRNVACLINKQKHRGKQNKTERDRDWILPERVWILHHARTRRQPLLQVQLRTHLLSSSLCVQNNNIKISNKKKRERERFHFFIISGWVKNFNA